MKKHLFSALLCLLFISVSQGIYCQTPAGSFQCNIHASQTLSAADINAFLTKANFENYRLLNAKTTLVFDNGFDVVLLSAAEAQQQGLISSISDYQQAFPKGFTLPSFHMSDNGKIVAGYTSSAKKHPTK